MHTRSRRTLLVVSVLALALALVACGPDVDSPSPTAAIVETPSPASPTRTASSTSPEPAASAPGEIGQTDTDWGRIWDALPAGFPRYPGGIAADDASPEPVSAAYAIADGDPAQIAEWMQTSLELATYSTEGLSGPYEDASFVLDSVGDDDCRVRTTIAPQGTLILVTVRYGADCPA